LVENHPVSNRIPSEMSEQEHSPNDPDRGLNTKVFMAALLVAIVVIFIAIYFFVASSGKKDIPKANRPHPNSSLQVTQSWVLS
jgi:hypothetical protein